MNEEVKSPPEADQPMAGKIFLWIFFLLIVASVGVTYYKIMIKRDYIIEAKADCDPTLEKCFVAECDPSAEECTGNPEEDTTYFKKVSRSAANIPTCDQESSEDCKPLECSEGEKDCVVTFCDETTKTEEDVCNDPVQYNIDNPAEEEGDEALECDPEVDENCTAPAEENTDIEKEDVDVE